MIAGVGTYDTADSVRRAREAEAAGADALLVVCPYYSRPTQAGVVAHCLAVADATELPVMLYDVPARTGITMTASTLIELAGHPRIRAVKDAKGDLFEAMTVMARTSLAYYCGIDELNLPYLACGAAGRGQRGGQRRRRPQRRPHPRGPPRRPRDGAGDPRFADSAGGRGRCATYPGATMAKAALAELGIIPHATVRLPLVEAPDLQPLKEALVPA